jgi:hypothetical protein
MIETKIIFTIFYYEFWRTLFTICISREGYLVSYSYDDFANRKELMTTFLLILKAYRITSQGSEGRGFDQLWWSNTDQQTKQLGIHHVGFYEFFILCPPPPFWCRRFKVFGLSRFSWLRFGLSLERLSMHGGHSSRLRSQLIPWGTMKLLTFQRLAVLAGKLRDQNGGICCASYPIPLCAPFPP